VSAAPDILWIVTTQWRAQACGYAGDPNARTPALDALAADPATVNYAQAVTPHPFGPFARAALLTGLASPANGLSDYWDPLPRGKRTIAHDLGERGYGTAFFGKWGVGERDPDAPLVGELAARIPVPAGARGGFRRWTGCEGGFLLNDPWLHGDGLEPGVEFARVDGYQSDVVCEFAANWLDIRGEEPGFTVVSLEAPHPPYAAETPVGVSRIQPEEVVLADNVPRGGDVEARARRELAGYHAHIAATDAAMGRLITRADAAADSMGRPRPIIVFTSVHGDMHGAHGLFRKGWPHEESVRVPLLVRGAPQTGALGVTRPTFGRCSDEAVSLVDLPAMTLAWSEGRAWSCPRDRAEISMPSVVRLPYQCDRVWSGWRSATEKRVFNADGVEWVLGE
jgi:arylsulfatase A-like enzyme